MSIARTVIVIPEKPELQKAASIRQQRVAAYCRVSTEEEEQQSSYENQCNYYTDLIMKNPNWSMAGIYADEGISGTQAKKRDDFMRMIKVCKKGKIEILSAVWIQSHDSSKNESPFEYPLKPLFRNRYKHRKRSEQLTQSVTRSIFHKGCIRIKINQATSSFFLLRRFTS